MRFSNFVSRFVFRPYCISKRSDNSSCWNHVKIKGTRCKTCWKDLLHSPQINQRMELAKAEYQPEWVQEQFLKDPNEDVREVYARTTKNTEHLKTLALSDTQDMVRRTAVKAITDPAILSLVAEKETSPVVLISVIENRYVTFPTSDLLISKKQSEIAKIATMKKDYLGTENDSPDAGLTAVEA